MISARISAPRAAAGVEIFERKDGRAFTEHQAAALAVKRPAFLRRRRLERIKSDKDQLGNGVVAAGEDAVVSAGADTFEGVADRVRSRGAGVGDHLAGSGNAEASCASMIGFCGG